jgi:hypothetical protein
VTAAVPSDVLASCAIKSSQVVEYAPQRPLQHLRNSACGLGLLRSWFASDKKALLPGKSLLRNRMDTIVSTSQQYKLLLLSHTIHRPANDALVMGERIRLHIIKPEPCSCTRSLAGQHETTAIRQSAAAMARVKL